MKKLFALVLALTLALSMTVTANAAGKANLADGISGGTEGTVTVEVTGVAAEAAKTYYVVVTWGDLSFEYDFNESKKTWDAENHKTVIHPDERTAKWSHTSADITVVNHSNDEITVSAAFAGTSHAANNVTASLVGGTQNLPSAEGKATDASELKASFTVSITDTVPSVKEDFTIDTVNLTIST